MNTRETKAIINLSNIAFNYQYFKDIAGKEVFAVVKANAYGHGDVEVSKHLEKTGVKVLCVSSLDEALHLKEHGIEADILIFGYVDPKYALQYNNPQFIFSIPSLDWFNTIKSLDTTFRLHMKVNTGMNRIGVSKLEDMKTITDNHKHKLEGIYTHLSSADENNNISNKQISKFKNIIKNLDYKFRWVHASNSHGALQDHDEMFNAVRVGIGLYGYTSIEAPLKPALSLITQVVHLEHVSACEGIGYNRTFVTEKESRIATLPIGYADGYDLRNQFVAINQKKYPIVGTVCMDQCMVEVDASVNKFDEVELVGPTMSVKAITHETGIHPYLITTALANRVTRVYIK